MNWHAQLAAACIGLILAASEPMAIKRAEPDEAAGGLTVARLRWGSDLPRSSYGFRSAWNHDYPRAEHISRLSSAS